jgi:adenylate cyclase
LTGSDAGRRDRGELQMSSIDAIASALEPVLPGVGRVSSPDGAVTLMLVDIHEAPAVAERLGPEGWSALMRDHTALVRQLVTHHDGEVVTEREDGFLASFPSAHAGLHCAVELQRTLGPGYDSPVRAGLHSGFVISNPDGPLGRNVVLAARIAAHAKGGEILVSQTLKEYTESDPSFSFRELGEFHFKGLLGEHTVYAVGWEDAGQQ